MLNSFQRGKSKTLMVVVLLFVAALLYKHMSAVSSDTQVMGEARDANGNLIPLLVTSSVGELDLTLKSLGVGITCRNFFYLTSFYQQSYIRMAIDNIFPRPCWMLISVLGLERTLN